MTVKMFLLVLLAVNVSCFAQSQKILTIADKTSEESLKKTITYLASAELQGRLMGTRGDSLTSKFVAESFSQSKIIAPFDNGKSYFQQVEAQQNQTAKEELTIAGKTFKRWEGIVAVESQTIQRKKLPVVFIGYGLQDSLYDDFKNIDVRGKAVLMLHSKPKFKHPIAFKNALASEKIAVLKAMGAVAILSFDAVFNDDKDRNIQNDNKLGFITPKTVTPSLPYILLSEARANELLSADKIEINKLQNTILVTERPHSFVLKGTIDINIQLKMKAVNGTNVIGIVNGQQPESGYLVVTAHHDHLGVVNGVLYPGACDNASGTAALMEIANLMSMATQAGLQPKRSVVFISTTGEEGGNLGAFWYLDHPVLPASKIYADVNLDIMGRVGDPYKGKKDSTHFVYVLQMDTIKSVFTKSLVSANANSSKLTIRNSYKNRSSDDPLRTMDTYPFILHGVPSMSFFSGLTKDALRPTETADKVNYPLLTRQTKLAFLTIWNLTQE